MSGEGLDATLKSPEAVAGQTMQTVHTTAAPNDPALLPLLRQKGVQIDVNSQQQSFPVQLVLSLLPWALIIGFWLWMSRRAKTMLGSGNPFAGMLKNQSRKFDKATSVNVTFEDIAGLKAAKRDLQEVVQFLKQPDRFQRLGGKVPRGVLLIGPPGTGKTLLARAVAGESGVAFYSISASEFIEMFVGLGAARVRDLFRDAKKSAPAIVFIDEIDAVGRARGAGLGGGNDEREQTLNQLLSEMDGFDRSDMVVVIAATNRPDVLDPALLRPGRFDRRCSSTGPRWRRARRSSRCTRRTNRSRSTSICRRSPRTRPDFRGPISPTSSTRPRCRPRAKGGTASRPRTSRRRSTRSCSGIRARRSSTPTRSGGSRFTRRATRSSPRSRPTRSRCIG